MDNERRRYNAVVSQIESRAKAHTEALVSRVIPPTLVDQVRAELAVLTATRTTDLASVQGRIDLFTKHNGSVMLLLRQIDELNRNEITRDV